MSRKLVILFLAGLLALILISVVLASPQAFDLSRWTVDGGGGVSEGGGYALSGTIGQPDVGYQMTGGDYTLVGGFWGGGEHTVESPLYLPIVTR
jgi:hypothetical protein